MIKIIIQTKINQIFTQISQRELELTFDEYKKLKASLSGKILAQKSGRKYHFLKSSVLKFLKAKTEY